jgi:peroxiredoxin
VWPEIKAFGATLVAISPQLERYTRDVIPQHKLSFDLLSDKGRGYLLRASLHTTPGPGRRLKDFGIDLKEHHGDNSWTLPVPGRFVVDQSGIIRSAEADPE